MDVLGILAVLAFVILVAFILGGTKTEAKTIIKVDPRKHQPRDKNGRFAKKK